MPVDAVVLAPDDGALTGSEFALRYGSAERLFKVLFDDNEDGFALIEVVFDDSGRPVDARNVAGNPALERHTGLRLTDIRARPASEYLPRLEQSWLDTMAAAIRTGRTQRIEQYQADTRRWYESVYFPFQGDIVGQFTRDVTERHLAAQALRVSQEQFRLLAEHSSDLVFSASADPDTVLTWVSPSSERLLGWQQQDLVGRNLHDLLHADDTAGLLDSLAALDDALPATVEARLNHANGESRWFSLSLHRLFDPTTQTTVLVAGARLIEDERRADEHVRRNEARLKSTLDSLIDPHVVLQAVRDHEGSITDFAVLEANDAACRFTARVYGEVVGAHLLGLLPGIGERLLPALADVVDSGEPLILDDFADPTVTRDSGKPTRRLDLRAVKVDDGLSYTWRDVTERYEGRQQVFASEERFRLAVNNVPTGVAVLDLDGHFDFVNPAFCGMLQRDAEWLLRRNMQQVLYPGEYAKLRHMIGLLTTGAGMVQQAQQRFVTSDGRPVQARHTVALLHRADGEPIGLLSHVQPVEPVALNPSANRAGRVAVARTSVLVAADDRSAFNAICATALLGQRPELITLPWASTSDLRNRLSADTPEVLVLVTSHGVAGPALVARVMTDVAAVAPHMGLLVLSANNRLQIEAMLRPRPAPSGYLPMTSVRSADMLAQAIATVSQGMGTFDPASIDDLVAGNDLPGDTRLGRLSEREQEVIALLAEGLDNQAIAGRLFVSVKATENYIGSIFRKLGLNTEEGTNRRVRATLIYLGER